MTGPNVIAVVGATATGKSALAMQLAQRLEAEIVNCDSVQVYAGFDIGSAKASPADRAAVPHHLLDVVTLPTVMDAQTYATAAAAAIADVHARGRTAILCGGTGLYFRALRYGLLDVPPSDPEARARIEAAERAEPGATLRALAELDPEGAARIDAANPVRVIRALEICQATGKAYSALQDAHGFADERQPMTALWLTRERANLHDRIAARTRTMLEAGLLEETQALLAGGAEPQSAPMQAVGYRETVAVLTGEARATELERAITIRTRRYARRQETWFRRERAMHVLDATDLPGEALADRALHLIGSPSP